MKYKLKTIGIMLSCLIIIISFVYAINIKPMLVGTYLSTVLKTHLTIITVLKQFLVI